MYMEKGLDTGDMIDKAEVVLDKKETAGSLHDKLMVLGADLLLETLKKLEDGTAVREKQNDEESCYAKMLSKDMGQIDFTKSAREIECLDPWNESMAKCLYILRWKDNESLGSRCA